LALQEGTRHLFLTTLTSHTNIFIMSWLSKSHFNGIKLYRAIHHGHRCLFICKSLTMFFSMHEHNSKVKNRLDILNLVIGM
jgi:hypothetical protein